MLPICLLLAAGCLPGSLSQEARTGEPRKPFFERVRRLEEQFRRFQEVTLRHLQGIAGNYNISYNIDTRFRHLAAQHDTVTAALNASHAALQEDLGPMKTWMKKLQKRTKKLASKLSSLAGSLGDSRKQSSGERLQQSALLSNLTLQTAGHTAELAALRASSNTLQSQLESLQEASRSQGTQMEVLEQRLKHMLHKEALASGHQKLATAQELNQTPQDKQPEAGGSQGPGVKLKAKRRQRKKTLAQQLLAQAANRGLQSSLARGSQTPGPETPTMPEPQAARPPPRSTTQISYEPLWPPAPENLGTLCNVGSMLLFPNASTENFAAFGQAFRTGLHELSACGWGSTPARSLGTILSYATEENDNKLVLHGRNTAPPGAIHFVIGDPAFRELPVGRLLDGRWHHVCVIWSSLQGKFWFYVDRRLAALGSRFQEGYEIPPGGSLILGQEQDVVGGGFDPSEAFVGRLAGFAIWDRALTPGEVSSIVTGKGLPRGVILSLADVSSLNGWVQKVNCTCLEHCV
uniref:Pentraxin 4 n=1 Tax=Pelodiscus sinensis TaxID=13735 RepID=K7GB06_PELSI|nr:pentraxin-4 [Pelodiscus sinensis]|eukprot:XP_006130647.1 pentraxin-4 [Pelodiscus sinensis]